MGTVFSPLGIKGPVLPLKESTDRANFSEDSFKQLYFFLNPSLGKQYGIWSSSKKDGRLDLKSDRELKKLACDINYE